MVALTRVQRARLVMFACLVLVLRARGAAAGGFQLNEQSARILAMAFAGTAATAEDGSTVYFNPAGMTLLSSGSTAATLALVDPDIELTGDATTLGDPNVTGPNGSHSAKGATTGPAAVPAFNFAQKLPWYDLAVGVGVTSPFGLKINYPADSIVRYAATLSELRVINGNLALAWQATPEFSIGAGFNIGYAIAHLNQILPPILGNKPALLEGDDVAFGWNAGAMYQLKPGLIDGTRVGVSWRSPIAYTLKGNGSLDSTLTGPRSGTIRAGAKTPGFLLASAQYGIDQHWQVFADFAWTHWSTFKVVTIDAASLGIGDVVNRFDFRDGYRGSIGGRWVPDQNWVFRAGLAYDASPVTDSTRTVRLPDADRVLLGLGFGYNLPKGLSLDFSYMHIFQDDGTINFKSDNPDMSTFVGRVESQVNLFAIQVTHSWDKFPPGLPF